MLHSYRAQRVVVSICARNSSYLRIILVTDIVDSLFSTHIQYLLHSSFCSSEPLNLALVSIQLFTTIPAR